MKEILILINSDSSLSNYRAKKIYKLRNIFDKFIILSKFGPNDNDKIITGSFPNPFGLLKKFKLNKLKILLDKIFYFPGPGILFVNRALIKLNRLIKKEYLNNNIIVLAITPPHINAVLGYKVKKRWPTIKLIIDWQDLWTYDEYHLNKTFFLYHNKLKKLEKNIFNIADMNVFTNEYAANFIKNEFKVNESKLTYIYHPFDKKELQNKKDNRAGNHKINLGFLGHLIKPPKVPGEKVIKAIEYCYASGINVHFDIYGDDQEITKTLIYKNNYQFVKLHKRVSHEESINKLIGCDFLLLCLEDLPSTKFIMHGKLSHYLLLKKPIIAFVPDDSFVANLIRRTQSGFVITTEQHWSKELHRILTEFDKANYLKNRNENEIEKFSWENISNKWLQAIEKASSL